MKRTEYSGIDRETDAINKGTRNITLTTIAGTLRAGGSDYEKIIEELTQDKQNQMQTPFIFLMRWKTLPEAYLLTRPMALMAIKRILKRIIYLR